MKMFTKCVEDFVCEQCNAQVVGTGYTNHCPQCLWSKHVDKNPGDRAETCGGMMEPVSIESSHAAYTILHRCVRCGSERRNKTAPGDDFETILAIVKRYTQNAL